MSVPNFLKENTELKLKKLNKVDEFGAYFSIPFVTDVHNAETTTYKWLNSIRVIEEVNKRKNINYVLTGGDYINNHENKEEVINRLKNFKDRFTDRSNVFITLGNHDDNSNYKDFSKVITHEEMKKLMFSDMKDVSFGNGLYYYKDFHEHKIRLIVLNSEDIPEYDSSMKYKGQWDYAFSNEQLNWVAHTALNTDYKIIFCSHTPMIQNVEGFDLAIRNSEAILGIMKAYTTATSYSSSNTTGDFKYNISVTYNKKGTIVCCLFGHVHADNIVYKDNIAHISTTCSNCSYRYGSSAIKNATGTVNEIALDFLTVGRKSGYLTRFGAGEDRTFSYINNSIQDNITNNQKGNTILQLFDKEKNKIAGLVGYENLCIESVLDTGDKTLSFYYSLFSNNYEDIEEETYIRTKTDEYVVKAKSGASNDNKTLFTCKLNVEELEGTIFDRFESVEQNLVDALNLAIVGTGWRLNSDSCNNRKKRTIRMTNCSSWTITQKAKKVYDIELKFDTLNKVIMLFDKIGEDRGVYFTDSLNLRALQVQGNSYGFYTRIIPIGKNGLTIASVNSGKIYLENKQYSDKTLTYYWKDERYVKPESLKEDALEKLNIMSKPFKSYIASTINLAEMNEKYKSILDYNLGDYIYLVSKKSKVKDKHRIVKTKEYPQDHSKDTVELANKALDLSEEKLLVDEMDITLDNVTTDNGTLNGSTIDSIQVKQIEDFKANVIEVVNLKAINASIDNLHVIKADIQDLNAVKARIGTLEATKANITQLTAVSAEIQQLNAIKANITDLNAASAKINVLESKTASIDNLLAGNLTANNFKANSITAGSGIIADGAIGDAQISSLNANKMIAGTLDTSLVTIAGPNGRLRLQGNKLQIMDNKDGKLYERIVLGVDSNNNSSLVLRGADGKTILLNQDGLTKAGITDGFNKIDDNSIDASLIFDKNSMVRIVNGSTETIKGTKVQIGDRTLDVELSTQKNTITEHGKELSSQKATIQALDSAIKLKVDSQTFTQSTTVLNNNINKAKEDAITTANNNISNAIDNLKIGGRNLAQLTEPKEYSSFTGRVNDCQMGYEILLDTLNVDDPVTVSYTFSYENLVPVNNHNDYGIWLQGCGDVTEWNSGGFPGGSRLTPKINWGTGHSGSFKVEYTFKLEANAKKNKKWFTSFRMDYIQSGKVSVKEFMVEYGTKANAYIQAPEDLKVYADKVAKAKADLAQANAIASADGKITEEERKRIQQAQENLNAAIARADKAKTDAIAYSDTLGQQLKANAEKYANDVAIAKSELAKQQSKAYADGIVTEEEKKRIKQAEANLNTAIAKANEAENKAREYADTKKIEAINKANTDAALKAAEALNSAKAFTTAEISTTNSNLHKATAEINILKEKIESKVGTADVEKAIQNIKLGGRNLVKKHNITLFNSTGTYEDSTNTWTLTATNGAGGIWGAGLCIRNSRDILIPYGEGFILSFEVKVPFNCTWNVDTNCYPITGTSWSGNDNDNGTKRKTSSKDLTANKWIKCWAYYENTNSQNTNFLDLYDESNIGIINNTGNNLTFQIRNIKGELGNKPSDWTPAPEDIDQLIIDSQNIVTEKIKVVESNLTQTKNSLDASVRDLNSTTQTITTNVSNINRDLSNKINSNLDAAKSYADVKKQEAIVGARSIPDTRNDNQSPGWYIEHYPKQLISEFKNANVIGITGTTYGILETKVPWVDPSGGFPVQTFRSNNTPTYQRRGLNATSWSSWEQIEDTEGSQSKANNALNNAKAYTNAEITTVNTKVHNVESNINILKNKIESKVSQSDIDKSIQEIKIGGRNLIVNSDILQNLFSPLSGYSGTREVINDEYALCKKDVIFKCTHAGTGFHLPLFTKNSNRIGKTYTWSFWAKCSVNKSGTIGHESNGQTQVEFTNEWKKFSHTWLFGDCTYSSFTFYIGWNTGEILYIRDFKIEEGTKATDWTPAPEDVNQLVVDSIRVVDTKISDVSSKITQLKDSVTIDINSINSKTHTIETTLGGKASKQEVTEVNNRLATIKANLDSITQRVSNTESKTNSLETNINGKASKQELTVVNNRVTEVQTSLNGITQRVGNTESRINTLDGKVAGAVTLQQFTEFKQSNDKFKFTVEQRSSVSNILPNGSFFGGDRGWLHGGTEFWSGAYSGYGFKGRMTGAIKNRTSYNNPERFLQTHKAYKVKKNTTYTISFHYACEMNIHSMEAYVVLSDTEAGDYAQPIKILEKPGGTQSDPNNEIPFTYKFNTGNHEWVWIRFDHNGMKPGTNWDQYCWLYVSEVGIYEGDVGNVKWTPKGGEVYSTTYQMDGLGFKGTFEDGTYASLGKDGLEWYNAGTGHSYHALTYVTSFDIPVGNPGKAYIRLPAEFTKRRKSLKWTVALRGYYYNTTGNFFPFHVHCTGARDYIENGLVVCEVQGLCKIQNGSNSGDVQFRPLTAMLIAIA
ncbi:phage tail protein [Clostridium perfringens]|nr:phage tail protein [Clostridium perfringens]